MRRLGLALWIDEDQNLRQLVSQFASAIFAKTQSAESVMFWYILLGKKALLASLYEKDMGGGEARPSGGCSKVSKHLYLDTVCGIYHSQFKDYFILMFGEITEMPK